MRKILVVGALLLGGMTCHAQEKVINVQKTDGSNTQTRVEELKEISFLAVEAGDQGLIVKTTAGETAGVRFEANPIVTVAEGKLSVKSSAADAMEFEISDIAEILFGDASDANAINDLKGFAYVLQDGGALLREIPKGVKPRVYSLDGRPYPCPPFKNGELHLNRTTLGKGVFIVKVGSFSTKIRL